MPKHMPQYEEDPAAKFKQWMAAHRVTGLDAAKETGIPYYRLMAAFRGTEELTAADMWRLMDWARLPSEKARYYFGGGTEE